MIIHTLLIKVRDQPQHPTKHFTLHKRITVSQCLPEVCCIKCPMQGKLQGGKLSCGVNASDSTALFPYFMDNPCNRQWYYKDKKYKLAHA